MSSEHAVDRTHEAAEPRARRRLGKAGLAWIIAGGVVVLLAIGFVVGDSAVRANAERDLAQQIENGFPENVTGDVTAEIGGFSVIWQYLTGTVESIELHAPELAIDGNPIAVSIDAVGVPIDRSKPLSSVHGTVVASETSLNALVDLPDVNGDFTLNDGLVGFDGTLEVLGFDLSYGVSASVEAAGDRVLLTPTAVQIGGGDNSDGLDLSGLANGLIGDDPIEVCTAQYLPDGLQVSNVDIDGREIELTLAASDLLIGDDPLNQRGACD